MINFVPPELRQDTHATRTKRFADSESAKEEDSKDTLKEQAMEFSIDSD